jgi:DNA invertase Pin-like site-specific DNA recombinase
MRAVIYARYSSDNQRDASIEDQPRLCKERRAREGWTLVQVYRDAAISGSSALRPGCQARLEAVDAPTQHNRGGAAPASQSAGWLR